MIYNVDPTGFDHVCASKESPESKPCGKKQHATHDQVERVERKGRVILKFRACDDHSDHAPGEPCGLRYGCRVHTEHFNAELSEADETSETRTEESREQVRNVRALYRFVLAGEQAKAA